MYMHNESMRWSRQIFVTASQKNGLRMSTMDLFQNINLKNKQKKRQLTITNKTRVNMFSLF